MSHSRPVDGGLPIEQPPGQDFFCVQVRIDTPKDPCWDDRFNIVDSWKNISQMLSRYLAIDPRARRSTVRIYQGQAARRQVHEGIREEARYQAEKRAQANN
jgi:hypothetical protein